MAVDLSAVHFEGRSTAYRLVQSPVILALLDQERLPQLAAEHGAASRVAAKACILAGQSATDLTEMIDAGIKDGDEISGRPRKDLLARSSPSASPTTR